MSHYPPKKNQQNQLPPQNATFTQMRYQGAIPPPEMMEHYAQIDPDLPNRIITMAEKNGDARREENKSVIRKSFQLDIVGQVTGLISVGGVIWLCNQMVNSGHSDYAMWLGGSVIVSLALVFVTRKPPLTNTNLQSPQPPLPPKP